MLTVGVAAVYTVSVATVDVAVRLAPKRVYLKTTR